MQRQPDSLQPDDEHELQPTTTNGCDQSRDVAPGERPDPEEAHVEHRLCHAQFQENEEDEQCDSTDYSGQNPGVAPALAAAAVGLDTVGDAREKHCQANAEDDVARPVDLATRVSRSGLVQRDVRPDRAENAERHAHDEDQMPVDGGQDAADDEPEERSGDSGDLVEAEGEAASVGREGIRQYGGRVCEQHRSANGLNDPPDDQPHGTSPAGERVERECDSCKGEDHEAEVVDLDSTIDVTESPEADDENRRHQDVAHEHPEQVAGVARVERVDLDALEDRRQRNQDDGSVDCCHQDAERRIAQRHPLVAGMVFVKRARARSFFSHERASRFGEASPLSADS